MEQARYAWLEFNAPSLDGVLNHYYFREGVSPTDGRVIFLSEGEKQLGKLH